MNSEVIKFTCPKCAEQAFKVSAEQYRNGELHGAVCNGCAYVLTEDDIRAQAAQIATDKVQAMLSATFGEAFKKF